MSKEAWCMLRYDDTGATKPASRRTIAVGNLACHDFGLRSWKACSIGLWLNMTLEWRMDGNI